MIRIDCKQPGEKFVPYWRTCVGAGRANEGLRAVFQRHLALVQENIGFRYVRMHALFHDDMFVMRKDEKGGYIFNFQYIDDLFDMLLEHHIRPFVELSFFPDCLNPGEGTLCWWKGHVTPPESLDGWCALIDAFIRHILSRYGAEEVHTWYFEVWNEPNLYGFWDGTRSQYFDLYKQTVRTIKAIDPALRVGGPATSNFVPDERFDGEKEVESLSLTHQVEDLDSLSWHGVWINEFLAYCAENALPVDFVSTHPYPTDFAVNDEGIVAGRSRGIDSLRKDLLWLRDAIRASAYPNAEIHLTEWSSSPSARDCTHDYLQQAAFIVKSNLDCIGLADSLSYWVFTDCFEETGAGDSVFHGGFGLINYQGIVKPGYHAYRMLAMLGDECIHQDENTFITRGDKGISGILYNYPIRETIAMSRYPDRSCAERDLNAGEAVTKEILLTGLAPYQRITLEQLDRQHGWGFGAWQQMGMPEPPDREQTKALIRAAHNTLIREEAADENGSLTLRITLEPWNIVSIRES